MLAFYLNCYIKSSKLFLAFIYKAVKILRKDNQGKEIIEHSHDKILNELLTYINEHSNYVYKYTKIIGNSGMCIVSESYREFCIVLQGSIAGNVEFIEESCEIYRKNFPGILLIISTWEDEENLEELQSFLHGKQDIELIRNKKPDYNGRGNVNYQIVSTRNGILRAEELGCKLCFKTRTDQRFNKRDIIPYFVNILKEYKSLEPGLKNRIIMMSYTNGSCNIAFDVCDFCAFGEVSDLKKYYQQPLEMRNYVREDINECKRKFFNIEREVLQSEFQCNEVSIGERHDYQEYILNVLYPEIYLISNFCLNLCWNMDEGGVEIFCIYIDLF